MFVWYFWCCRKPGIEAYKRPQRTTIGALCCLVPFLTDHILTAFTDHIPTTYDTDYEPTTYRLPLVTTYQPHTNWMNLFTIILLHCFVHSHILVCSLICCIVRDKFSFNLSSCGIILSHCSVMTSVSLISHACPLTRSLSPLASVAWVVLKPKLPRSVAASGWLLRYVLQASVLQYIHAQYLHNMCCSWNVQ